MRLRPPFGNLSPNPFEAHVLRDLEVDFLLTNDDGIDAYGLQALGQAIGAIGTMAMVAPDTVRSCCSHGVTTAEALQVVQINSVSWKVSGTPADCIRVAIKHLRIRPKWVLSGVNEGGNLGVDIHYSGTVAGAREAALMGLRSMAISQYLRRDRPRHWELTALRAIHAWSHLQSFELEPTEFWNINLPVVESTRVDLPLVQCRPEPQMLTYDFACVDQESSDQEPSDQGRSDQGHSDPAQWLKYRSNYQERPRSESLDVAQCFSGQITATRLSSKF
ncbi:MAG: 5'/3'-nucleotidase SurE [Planctomycetota bacterium]|nr:MAG: 5'/3'-nucleotidase SurE [Planctomycetota bacterium]